MTLKDFSYELPERLIATQPAEPRDHARLMVVHRDSATIEHALFKDLGRWLGAEDLLILNKSKVIPARLPAEQGAVEIFLLEETSPLHWLAIGKPSKKLKPGMRLRLVTPQPDMTPPEVEVLKTLPDGRRVIRFFEPVDLERFGGVPLPPYIEEARRERNLPIVQPEDKVWYQTVYAEEAGSVAAPTAGLHFTPELLQKFPHAFITLHVGLGTFRPVKTQRLEEHVMHAEKYSIPAGLAEKAARAKRVISVGTTVARVLEAVPSLQPSTGQTDIFIYPPYRFKRVDAMITNFHLPGSSLLMLVAAFMGLELQRKAYEEAIRQEYSFYSYGDAMLIL
ncbi:MAG: tRNA preQ1(34) S-adenosylmethionine ribosyltransferase-isomerase QueA [bacterium]